MQGYMQTAKIYKYSFNRRAYQVQRPSEAKEKRQLNPKHKQKPDQKPTKPTKANKSQQKPAKASKATRATLEGNKQNKKTQQKYSA